MISQADLKQLLHYCPETGCFTRLVNKGGIKAGSTAGCMDAHGYLNIQVSGKLYKSHRLAFLYMTGSFPKHEVDHINGVRDDNRWCNLRDVTRKENAKNMKVHKDGTSGVIGVTWFRSRNKWCAGIYVDGKHINLGYFDTVEAAEAARISASKQHNFHPNHGRTA